MFVVPLSEAAVHVRPSMILRRSYGRKSTPPFPSASKFNAIETVSGADP
jgi:hypothetical protein